MPNEQNPVVLCQSDYHILSQLLNLNNGTHKPAENSLAYEVERAIIVKDTAFPLHTIKLNSLVTVLDIDDDKEHQFTIVSPEEANIKEKKISILSPMAAAIIGFREGETTQWQMPSGIKLFKIIEVNNSAFEQKIHQKAC